MPFLGAMTDRQIKEFDSSIGGVAIKYALGRRIAQLEAVSGGQGGFALGDNELMKFGTGTTAPNNYDVKVLFNATNLQFLPRTDDTGAIHIGDGTTDMDFKWFGGSTSNYVLFDMGNAQVTLEACDLHLGDTDFLEFGDATAGDFAMNFDGTNLEILPATDDTGAVHIGDGTYDADFKVFMGDSGDYVLFDNSAKLVSFIDTQIIMGAQGTGVPTATASPNALEVHAETNGSAVLTSPASGLSCGIRCRYEISKAQTENLSFVGSEGRLRVKAAMAEGNHCGIMGTIEADGAIAFTGSATTMRSAASFTVELGASCTFGSTSGWLQGVVIDSSVDATQVGMSNITFVGLRIKKSTGKYAFEHGIYLDTSAATTGIYVGTCTTGVSFAGDMTTAISTSGNITNPIYIGHIGSAGDHVIDMIDAYAGMFIETGSYSSAADKGITLTDSNTRPVSFLFDDSAAALTGNNRAVLSRVYLAESQGAGCTIVSIQGQLKMADDKDFSAGRFCGVDGYLEFGGSTDINSGAYVAAMNARVDVAASETVTVKSGGYLAGLHIQTTGTGTLTQDSGCISAAILVNDMGTVDDWDHGLHISNCSTGITIGACGTDAISISGTFSNAASRGVKSVVTVNNANYGDGYSANDFEFHMTGTAAGHVAAGGMWVNIDSGTHEDSNFICAQTNGVYQAAGSITGKRVIFGMRMAHQCTNNGSTYFFPFSIVSAGGANSTTALFHTNAAAVNMGAVTNAGSDDGVLVPLYWEGDGANIGYVKIYSLA